MIKTQVEFAGTYSEAEDAIEIVDMILGMVSADSLRTPCESDNGKHSFVIETDDEVTSGDMEKIARLLLHYVAHGSVRVHRLNARYEVRDQNGDVLRSFDNYGLASRYFSDWISGGTRGLRGAGIYDNENDTFQRQLRFTDEDF